MVVMHILGLFDTSTEQKVKVFNDGECVFEGLLHDMPNKICYAEVGAIKNLTDGDVLTTFLVDEQ